MNTRYIQAISTLKWYFVKWTAELWYLDRIVTFKIPHISWIYRNELEASTLNSFCNSTSMSQNPWKSQEKHSSPLSLWWRGLTVYRYCMCRILIKFTYLLSYLSTYSTLCNWHENFIDTCIQWRIKKSKCLSV